jgi:enolase-phosphatase E1
MSAVLLDIEGTVSDKRFVTQTLFPFARERIADFVALHQLQPEVAAAIALMREKLGQRDASVDDIGHALVRWIDEDRKEEPLKTLQGLIWAQGYASGALISHIYADVPPALERWKRAGKRLAIFSSGSIGAQKLLFAHTSVGDLTPYFSGYFDLSTGPKMEAASYLTIAKALDHLPRDVTFYSDATREVEAALAAGMQSILVERDGPIAGAPDLKRITDFAGQQ